MRSIPVDQLKPGTKYSKPVYIDGEHLLVPEHVALREKDIERLRKWGIETVLTDGEVVTELSALEQVADTIGNILDQRDSTQNVTGPISLYRHTVTVLDRIFDEIKDNRQINRTELDEAIEKLIEAAQSWPDAMVALVLRAERTEPSPGKSATDCCILSVVVGMSMSLDKLKLQTLGFAAALHDIGMLRVPDSILIKKSDLNIEEIKRVRTHTLHSYRIVSKDLGYPEEIGLIALQHHERWDGKGYPRKLAQKQIALEARIVAVADAFEAMVKERPYRNSMIGYTAVRQLLNDNSRRFDSEILKVFIKAIGIYPIGSFVLLNNGGIGRVVKINRGVPLRPVIKVLIDNEGHKYLRNDGPVVDLLAEKDLFIAKAIDPNNALGASRTI